MSADDKENESNEDKMSEERSSEEVVQKMVSIPKKVGKKKKKSKKAKNTEKVKNVEEDLSTILKDLNIELNETTEMTGTENVLSINVSYLNPSFEMQKIYGKDIVKDDTKKFKPTKQSKKYLFETNPQWPDVSRDTIPINVVQVGLKDDVPIFHCIQSDAYNKVQDAFIDAFNSGNIMNLEHIVIYHPYHIDTLLELSDVLLNILKERDPAFDYLGRILHKFESSFNTSFNPLKKKCRLPYTYSGNRGFHLALINYIKAVGAKGCPKTALEFSKLLFSLDDSDVLGVRHMIDHYAIRSSDYEFLLKLFYSSEYHELFKSLPNMLYHISLAKFSLEIEKSKKLKEDIPCPNSNELLENAILKFPQLFATLAKSISIPGSTDILSNPFFSLDSITPHMNLAIQAFIERNSYLWKDQSTLQWLSKSALNIIEKMNNEDIKAKIKENKEWVSKEYGSSPKRDLMVNIYITLESTVSLIPKGEFAQGIDVYDNT